MIQLTFLPKYAKQAFITLLLGLLAVSSLFGQTTITHNINTDGTLTIAGSSPNSYKVVGSGAVTSNRVIVQSGYKGTITLRNIWIRVSGNLAPIRVYGLTGGDVLDPETKVNIILEGYNLLEAGVGNTSDPKTSGVATASDAAALQVDRGAQIHISAVDPNDNTSGELVARSYHASDGGAGIGGPNCVRTNGDSGPQGTTAGGGGAGTMNSSGGNVIISSGTIFARGGRCGAGIGGGYTALYPGHIVIFGGNVRAYGGDHSAGIGTGCPAGSGNNGWFALSSSIIVLPPAGITATTEQPGKPGLAGANDITYVGDPQSPLVAVKTEYPENYANIYADLTETTSVASIFTGLGIPSTLYELSKGLFGNTGSTGALTFRATFKQKITFFTDASCTNPAKLGRPFGPKSVPSISSATTIILPLLDIGMVLEPTPSSPLEEGYTASQALANSYMLKLTYTDANPMSAVLFELQSGSATNFAGLKYYGADGVTELTGAAIPTTLTSGMVLYIKVPIKQSKQKGIYNDVLRFTGTWKGDNIGYVRQVVTQRVVYDDSNTNTYIKVTASENKFTVVHPTTKSINLTLKISHAGLSETYNPGDVTAKYLVTTQPDYDLALAANPLSTWTNMTIPVNESDSPTTAVSFAGKTPGTYYIHWYVISGVVYAHSLTVTDPPRTYGGFGPYTLQKAEITLSLNKTSLDEGGGATTGTATLTATLAGVGVAPTGGIPIALTYSGTATHITDYTAPTSITIPAGSSSATISIIALADNLIEGNETISITAPATVTAGSIPYDILGSPLSILVVDKTDGTIEVVKQNDASEPITNGIFRIKYRNSSVTRTIATKVLYTITGAPASTSYTVSPTPVGEATIPAGSNYVDVLINVLNNYIVEGDRSIKIEITNPTPL